MSDNSEATSGDVSFITGRKRNFPIFFDMRRLAT
jgi:hypothetical protein